MPAKLHTVKKDRVIFVSHFCARYMVVTSISPRPSESQMAWRITVNHRILSLSGESGTLFTRTALSENFPGLRHFAVANGANPSN
jgi:hypothetical protein